METSDTAWLASESARAKNFTGIGGYDADGRPVWYPSATGPVEMEVGIAYHIAVRDGLAYLTRVGHRFDV